MRLTMTSTGEALNVCPRPVFWEELDFLGAKDLGWEYPHCQEPIMWACDRRYFYRGELVLEVKGGNVYDAPSVILPKDCTRKKFEPIDLSSLAKKNEDSMFLIEHEALDFISESFLRYKSAKQQTKDVDYNKLAELVGKKRRKEHVVIREECGSFDVISSEKAEQQGKPSILNSNIEIFVVSFSGGKDSQVMLDLTTRSIPSSEFIVVYSDTGYELPSSLSLYKEIEIYYKNRYPTLRFELAKNHESVLHYWDEMGSPSNIHRWCCSVMKTAPLYKKLKEIAGLGRQPHVMSFVGTRADESLRRSNYARIAKDAKHSNVVNVSPILDWSTTEVWLYLLIKQIPFNHAYRYGLGRVGCVSCPFGSDWNDYLCNHIFPQKNAPFLQKIEQIAKRNGVKDIDDYIRCGNWKIRAGGSGYETKSNLSLISTTPDFKALITQPKEDITQWIKVLGKCNVKEDKESLLYTIKYKEKLYNIKLQYKPKNNSIVVDVPNVGDDIFFISHLRRMLNKATYCVNCELCEVECPTGALSVVPNVTIDDNKCIHCKKCLDFKDNGCITATSIKRTEGIKMESQKNKKTTINRYNNFGYRNAWLSYYLSNYETYFQNEEHGLNVVNQLPAFTNWLRDSCILENTSKTITNMGISLSNIIASSPNVVWEIIWVNLNNFSEICSWYSSHAEYNKQYTKEELELLLEETLPQYSSSVRKNAFGSLQNTFAKSPLGENLGVGKLSKANNKAVFTRLPHNDLSLVATAYSLYRYAEKSGRRSLTVSEFYNPEQKEGIVRQFGIEREAFEQNLRTLEQERNHVLRAELKMGLDNIILRDDLTSDDIIKMML